MAGFLQTGLDLLVKNAGHLSPWAQDTATKFAATAAPTFLAFTHREFSFERHPLQTLHHLLQRALRGEPVADLQAKLEAVPEVVRNSIYFEVWSLATDANKGGDKWGERNALANLPRLLNAIKAVAEKKLDALPIEKQNAVFGTVYRMAKQPQVSDPKWGEHNAKADTERLIRALHRNHALCMRGQQIPFYSDLEKDAKTPSTNFNLHRRELDRGQICMINGMGCVYPEAWKSAYKISDEWAQGYNVHCTYSATIDPRWDVTSALLGQGGAATPAVLQLLDRWQDFFETDESNRLLQICTSRGAIELNNALHLLPPQLRQRIIVIAIAPACLISQEMAYKAVNLLIPEDPVVQVAANRHLIDAQHTIKLPLQSGENPHNMFNSSFRDRVTPMIDAFIRTNDIS